MITTNGLTGVKELDWELLKDLPISNILNYRTVSKDYKSHITNLFNKLTVRDFKRYLDQKIIDKSPQELQFSDYKALYLFRKNLISTNIRQNRYSFGLGVVIQHPLWPRIFGEEMGLLKALYKDSCVFYLPKKEKEPSGRIAVLKLDGTIYEFTISFAPSTIFVIGFTVFIFQKESRPGFCHQTLSLYDCRTGAPIGSSYKFDQCNEVWDHLYWISNDNLILNIKNTRLEILSPSGKKELLYQCEEGIAILSHKILDDKNFILRVGNIQEMETVGTCQSIIFRQNQQCLSFSHGLCNSACGYFEDGTFWTNSDLDPQNFSIKIWRHLKNPSEKIFSRPKEFFVLKFNNTILEHYKTPNASICYTFQTSKNTIDDICTIGKHILLFGKGFSLTSSENSLVTQFINHHMVFSEVSRVIDDYAILAKNRTDNSSHFFDFSITSRELLLSLTNPYLLSKYRLCTESQLRNFFGDILEKLVKAWKALGRTQNCNPSQNEIQVMLSDSEGFSKAIENFLETDEGKEINKKDIEAHLPKS